MPDDVDIRDATGAIATVATRDKGGREVPLVQLDLGNSSTITPAEGTLPISAASLPLPTGAAQEAGGNLATLVDRTPVLGQAAASASQPVVLANDQMVSGGAALSAINIDLLTGSASGWFDASTFHSASIQIIASTGITAGQIFFEQTNDTTAAPNGNIWPVEEDSSLIPTPNVAPITIAASAVRMFRGSVTARFVRVRISTAFVGGTVRAIGAFSQMPFTRLVQTVHQPTAANLNVTVAGTVTANIGTGSLAAGTAAIGDVGTQYRANATGAATATNVNCPATPVGQTIKGAAGRLLGMRLTNTGAAARFVKFFNATAVTPGTTAAAFELALPVNASVDINFEGGIAFSTGIIIMVTAAAGLTNNAAVSASDVVGFTIHA